LDEPTNHLDFESIEALAIAIESFEGAVVVVSHNVSFLSVAFKDLWIVQDGRVDVLKATEGGDGFMEHFQRYAEGVRGYREELHRRRGGARRAVALRGTEGQSSAAC